MKVETREGFALSKSKWLSQVLNVIYVLLALSVIVSLFGIVNTPVGVALAALAARGLHAYGLTLSVPVPSLAILVLLP